LNISNTLLANHKVYLFNLVDDLAVIKFIPILIHDMEHCIAEKKKGRRQAAPTTQHIHQRVEEKEGKIYKSKQKKPRFASPQKGAIFPPIIFLNFPKTTAAEQGAWVATHRP